MSILVFLQHTNGNVPKATLGTIAAALEIKERWNKSKTIGLVLGTGASTAAGAVNGYGLDQLLINEDKVFDRYFAPHFCDALKSAIDTAGIDTVVATATSTGKDFIPRFAALWDAGVASDIIGVNSDGTLKRPMYAGDVLADIEINSSNKCITVRSAAFSAPAPSQAATPQQNLAVSIAPHQLGEVVDYSVSVAERPELTDASIVVSGGRALQSSENFEKYIFPLADSLGAAVGASRAAVDSGYAPNDWQVGQTGKIVAPELYIAVGISGAIQHLAGMKDSKVIVAINKDAEAPIFEVADYGLVADLYQAIPELTAEIKKGEGELIAVRIYSLWRCEIRRCLILILIFFTVRSSAWADSRTVAGTFFREGTSIGAPIELEIAETSALRELGLMYRRELPENSGMIFIYPKEAPRSFWMKNTYISLDMIFLGEKLKVRGILENVPPLTVSPRDVPGIQSKFVVELNAGKAAALHLQNGDELRITGSLPVAEDGN